MGGGLVPICPPKKTPFGEYIAVPLIPNNPKLILRDGPSRLLIGPPAIKRNGPVLPMNPPPSPSEPNSRKSQQFPPVGRLQAMPPLRSNPQTGMNVTPHPNPMVIGGSRRAKIAIDSRIEGRSKGFGVTVFDDGGSGRAVTGIVSLCSGLSSGPIRPASLS